MVRCDRYQNLFERQSYAVCGSCSKLFSVPRISSRYVRGFLAAQRKQVNGRDVHNRQRFIDLAIETGRK